MHTGSDEKSYANLKAARERKKQEDGYNSDAFRSKMLDEFFRRTGHVLHPWQLDVGEASVLGLDSVVIAKTGEGKTIPFTLLPIHDKTKKVLILSPLKVLQEDQVARFKRMGIRAAAVNGDTWTPKLARKLNRGRYQAIFTSPEMCLKHPEFRAYLSSAALSNDLGLVVVDEAHCISQWGGEFRKEYGNIDRLRAFFPTHIPFLLTSATLSPGVLTELEGHFDMKMDKAFYLNRGNDRPNIDFSVQHVKSPTDYEALLPLLSKSGGTPDSPQQLRKTIIFVNSVASAQQCARFIKSQLPEAVRGSVDVLHALRSRRAKRRVMREFKDGDTMVLIATEAAGMGADIPDIEQVIQLGVPSSLAVWIQRAGRAGRSPKMKARAILMVEPSVFQKVRRAGTTVDEGIGNASDSGGDSNDEDGRDVKVGPEERRKKVEAALLRWIETELCRRDVVDEYFGNPPGRDEPLGGCCDNCDGTSLLFDIRPRTPAQSEAPSPPLSPSTSSTTSSPSFAASEPGAPNANGKRPMEVALVKKPPKRSKEHLANVKKALTSFRLKIKRAHFRRTSYTADVVFPDRLLNALALHRHIRSLGDLESAAKIPWVYGDWAPEVEPAVAERVPTLFEQALALTVELDIAKYHANKRQSRVKIWERAANAATRRTAKLERQERQARVEAEKREVLKDKEIAAEQKRLDQLQQGFSNFATGSSGSAPAVPQGAPPTFEVEVRISLRQIVNICSNVHLVAA